MNFLIKILWFVSVIGFMIVLFATYKNLAPQVYVDLESVATRNTPIDKNLYFYGCVSLFLIFSLVIYFIARLVQATPRKLMFAPYKEYWFSDADTKIALYSAYNRWFFGILSVINMFLMLMMMVIEQNNHIDGRQQYNYDIFYAISVILFVLTLISLPVRLLIKKSDLINQA